MSEKGNVTIAPNHGRSLISSTELELQREKLARCTSQTFQESLIFWKNNTHDSENPPQTLTTTPPNFKGRRIQQTIPNTRPPLKHSREDSTGVNELENPNSLSKSHELVLNAPRYEDEHHACHEEINKLKKLIGELRIENMELRKENAFLVQEKKELKSTKSYFNSPHKNQTQNNTETQTISLHVDISIPNTNNANENKDNTNNANENKENTNNANVNKANGSDFKFILTSSDSTRTIIQLPSENDDNKTAKPTETTTTSATTSNTETTTTTTATAETTPKNDDTTVSESTTTMSESNTHLSNNVRTPKKERVSSNRNRDNAKLPAARSHRGSSKPERHSSKKDRGDKIERKESKGEKVNKQTSPRSHSSDRERDRDSRRSLHLLRSSDAEKGGEDDLTSKEKRRLDRKERAKSQNLDHLKEEVALERGACNTQDCSCTIYVHSGTEVCLRCNHALGSHALPDDKYIPPNTDTNTNTTNNNNNSENTNNASSTPIANTSTTNTPTTNTSTAQNTSNSNLKKDDSQQLEKKVVIGSDTVIKSNSGQVKKETSLKKVTIENPKDKENGEKKDNGKEVVVEGSGDPDFHHVGDDLAQKWIISYSELTFVDKLGKGISSVVYTGKYKGKDVAIKVLRLENKFINDCKGELAIMSQIHSPYVVQFYGATLDTKLTVVMEICENGSLFHCLQNQQIGVFWKRALKWSMEIVCGMNILHEWNPIILHRDMKSLNLLVDGEWNLKLCDFGLSRFNTEASQQATLAKLRGTYTYTAPEMYFKNKYTTKSDVFSIGVIYWEIVTRLMGGKYVRPYSEYKDINMDYQIIYRVATKGLRPTMPVGCPEGYHNMITRCLDNLPENRPSCRELMDIINLLKKDFKKKKQKWKKTEFVEEKKKEKKL